MSKWLHLLQECEKNKNLENQPMSVLSASYRGILSKKNNNNSNPKIENPYFPPMSAMLASNSKNNDIKNKIKNQKEYLYRPADIADIGSIPPKSSELLNFPTIWSNAIEITLTRNTPQNILESRWRTIIKRLEVLIHEEKPHLLKMIEYEWSLEEVFGCHKFAPDVRIDGMGLLMLLPNVSIAEIKPTGAFLKHKDESITTYSLRMMNHNRQERSTLMEIE